MRCSHREDAASAEVPFEDANQDLLRDVFECSVRGRLGEPLRVYAEARGGGGEGVDATAEHKARRVVLPDEAIVKEAIHPIQLVSGMAI